MLWELLPYVYNPIGIGFLKVQYHTEGHGCSIPLGLVLQIHVFAKSSNVSQTQERQIEALISALRLCTTQNVKGPQPRRC